jgi:predicted NBD/HSP70 family sugar kinase
VDPDTPNPADRAGKLRAQQERQAIAYILVRQATALLQRTRLHVTLTCTAWHAKHARHMLLDVVDVVAPALLIVGSRGVGQLKGILLGSTSHYLLQKAGVPVMVARRRLKRPPSARAHLDPRRAQPRVRLAQAGIDRVARRVDQDVAHMREEVDEDDARRDAGVPEVDGEDEDDGPEGTKVAGEA